MNINVIKSAWRMIKDDEEGSDNDDSESYLITKRDKNFSLSDYSTDESESESDSESE